MHSGVTIGTVTNPVFFTNVQFGINDIRGVDAMMVIPISAYHANRFVNQVNGRRVDGPALSPSQGQRLNAISTPTRHQSGIVVTSLNFEGPFGIRLVQTTGTARDGDSGGLVYHLPGAPAAFVRPVGIIVSSDINYRNMAFSRADAINPTLGVSIP